jgi:ketosteroid isomerase-like protein
VSARAERWKAAWESRDADRVAALYLPDATHASSLVPRLFPQPDGEAVLRGVETIREYARLALARFTELRFAIENVVEDSDRTAIEYRRHSNLDVAKPSHVLELIEWSGDRIRAVRVFHFGS